MPSHNDKYYIKSIKSNDVLSKKITSMFKRKTTVDEQDQPAKRLTPSVEIQSEQHDDTTLCDVAESQPTASSSLVSNNDNIFDSLSSDEDPISESPSNDLRRRNIPSYENIYPEFYYSTLEKGWYCKICTSFSTNVASSRPFVTKVGNFGDHPTRRTNQHLNSSHHLECVKNKQAFDELSKKKTDVWRLLQESSLSQSVKKLSTNRFVIKCFFRITHLMIKKNWAHTHNFQDIVELIAECGGKEVQTHLLSAPKNATYMSAQYIAKYIDVINQYLEVPLLTSLRQNKFAMYNDETRDITSVEQMAIYATFNHNGKISEHFVGIIPISKMVGTHLSATNILHAFERYFEKLEVPFFRNARFFMMDTTNVNSGEKKGLKRLLKHLIPMASWIGCGNHKVALCFKHLLPEFKSVFSADATLLVLWKFFHYRPLAMSFMENVAEIYGESLVIPVCPSVTRWTAHDRACKSLYDGYKQFLNALGVCVNERKESEAVGIFSEITDCEFIATILMLRDVFDAVQPLNLVLQKGDGSLCLADIPVYLHKTLKGLEKLESPENRKWCQEEKFNELKEMADEETLNMPPSSKLRSSNQFNFAFFIQNTYIPFAHRFTEEIQEAFKQLDFWLCFIIFDPRMLPNNEEDFIEYGKNELDKLASWYGEPKIDRMDGEESHQPPDINPINLKFEWQGFLSVISERRRLYQQKIDIQLLRAKAQEDRESLQKERNQYTPTKFWNHTYQDMVIRELYPQCMYLLELSIMFPLSVSCVERLFSKMKLVKTRLRNQLSQVSLESLLRISTESPTTFSDETYEFFVDELKRLNPQMKMSI